MVLYLIGLGLYDEQDITLRGLKAVQQCERVYLEAYTSILLCDKAKLEALYGKDVVVADREMVESQADVILENADKVDVAFLVVGDPFGATTHTGMLEGLNGFNALAGWRDILCCLLAPLLMPLLSC